MGRRKSGGFTLIELLAVMLILSICVAVSRPVFGTLMAGTRARATIREMVTDMRHAQQMAVSEGKNYYIYFDCQNNFYRIKTASNPQPKIIKQISLEGNIRLIGTSIKEFRFSGSGAAVPGLTIYLQDYRGKDYSITVRPATGRVRVYH